MATSKPKASDEATCPKCGGLMEGGVCSSCGFTGSEAPCVEEDGCKPKTKDACGTKPKKPKADGTSVQRLDYWGPLNESVHKTEPMELQADGSYRGKAAVTCVGVFRYTLPDGTIRNEFRPPEEVFKKESLESLELRPLTNTHPATGVNPDNFQQLAVGTLGEEIENDAYNVYAELTIQEAGAIAAAQSGRTGLSCGYSADMVESGTVEYPVMGYREDPMDGVYKEMEIGRQVYQVPGVWGGVPYDAIQTNIVYNHVALVDVPRGGDALHLRFDGADQPIGVLVPRVDGNSAGGNSAQERNNMKKIRLDGAVEHEVPEAVADHISALQAKVDGFPAELSTLQGKLDSASEALAAEKQARADEAAGLQAKIDGAVSARLALVAVAQKHGIKADGADAEIRSAVILAAFPSAKLDGRDAAYIDARFDAACEVLDSKDPVVSQRQQIADGDPTKSTQKTDSVEARLAGAWKSN